MKVIATAPGFYGSLRQIGDEFEVADKSKATWFEPVKAEKPKKDEGKKDEGEAGLV